MTLQAMSLNGIRVALSDIDKMERKESGYLIDAWIKIEEEHAKDAELLNRLTFVLQKRMEARGATAEPHPTHDVTFESSANTYDQAALTPILELVEEAVAIADGAYTAAYEEKVQRPAKWDVRKARALKKYNAGVDAIVEAAKRPNRPQLRITPKAP